jgi:hypothetical protein
MGNQVDQAYEKMRDNWARQRDREVLGIFLSLGNSTMVNSESKPKSRNLDLKHKITVILSVAIVVVAGFFVVHAHDKYVRNQAQEQAVAQEAADRAANTNTKQEQTFLAGVKLDEAQCTKDQAAYNALPATSKTKAVAPDCEADLVQ